MLCVMTGSLDMGGTRMVGSATTVVLVVGIMDKDRENSEPEMVVIGGTCYVEATNS